MRLVQVETRRHRAKCVDFSYELYRNDPGFVDTSLILTRCRHLPIATCWRVLH